MRRPSPTVTTSLLLLIVLLLFTAACRPPEEADAGRVDPHSFARPDEIAVEHLALDLDVDFETHKLRGHVALTLKNAGGQRTLRLDTRDLTILGVTLDDGTTPAKWRLGEPQGYLGAELRVEVEPDTPTVYVDYETDPGAAALQWLTPEQTSGGRHPFLFSQSQAILARTWVPCQDTPGVRFTYEATLRVPPGLLALMSAENPTAVSGDGVYTFRMPQPVPSYLLAIAVGDLGFRPLGERAGVYAEPEVVEKAAWEFAETEAMMTAVEGLYGPYRWGRYDLLVLPPSFPFGGMENPRLTFATPTILAGDRSLVALVAHELAHSWSGNLVTNATWNDFWLNEGFTVYLEMRIMEELYGSPYANMLALLARQDLERTIAELGPESPATHLRLDLAGRDPDEGTGAVAYEKGYAFLRMVEETVGRERFDPFLQAWFDGHAFQSVTTDDFVGELREKLVAGDQALEAELEIDRWVDGPGLPENAPVIESRAFADVEAEIAAWEGGKPAAELATEGWNAHQWTHFVRSLPASLTAEQMAELDAAFGFTASGNSEVLHAWLLQVVDHGYEPGYAAVEDFLVRVGRVKFVRPLFLHLVATDEGRAMAERIYEKARPGYHPLTVAAVDAVLKSDP